MKKLLNACLCTLLISTSILSCTKSASTLKDDNVEKTVNTLKISKVNVLTGIEQKAAYALLTDIEKTSLWKSKFENILLKDNLTQGQEEFVSELVKKLNIGVLYMTDKEAQNTILSGLAKKSVTLFTYDQAYNLMATLNPSINSEIIILDDDGNPPPPKCNCSQSSDWCLTGDCRPTKIACTQSSGCGTFWSYQCDGKCNK